MDCQVYYSPLPHTAVKRVTYNLENTYLALENEQGVRGGGARRLIYGRYGEGGGMVVKRWSSVDEGEGKDKVERLEFDGEGWLVRVAVVDRDDRSW